MSNGKIKSDPVPVTPGATKTMHADLVAIIMALERRVDAAGTPAEVAVLADQIREINRRVTALGRAVLIDVTIEITLAASSLHDAIPAVIDAIDEAESTASAARQVTAALSIVDAALNNIKQVG